MMALITALVLESVKNIYIWGSSWVQWGLN